MKLRTIQGDDLRERPVTPEEAFEEALSVPFKKGDKVKIKDDSIDISISHPKLKDKILIVDKCYLADIGNLLAEVVYFEEQPGVMNPYLSEYFEKIEDETEDIGDTE